MGLFSWLFGERPAKAHGRNDRSTVTSLPTGKFATDRHRPDGEWVNTTIGISVAGIQHRFQSVVEFAAAAKQAEDSGSHYGLRLAPEPTNAHDKNAIKVFGVVGEKEWHIGYLRQETAKEITADLVSKGIPIAATLLNIYVSPSGFIDVNFLILAPPGNSHTSRLRKRKA